MGIYRYIIAPCTQLLCVLFVHQKQIIIVTSIFQDRFSKKPAETKTCLKDSANGAVINCTGGAALLAVESDGLSCQILGLLLVNLGLAAEEISSLWLHLLRLHDELVTEDHDDVEWDSEVGGDEVLVVELSVSSWLVVWHKVVESLEESDEAAEEERDVGSPDSSWRDEWHLAVEDTLGLASSNKVDVGDQDRDPGEDTEDGDEVDEVGEDDLGGSANVEVGEEAESGGKSKGVNWDTTAISAGEDAWSVTLDGKTVESTGSNVQIGVGSGEDEDQDTAVEDTWQGLDTGVLDGDDEWRGSSGCSLRSGGDSGNKTWVVMWKNHSEEEDQHDVEEQDAVEGKTDGSWNDLAWVLGLTNGDTDQFDTEVGEDGGGQHRPESEEATSRALRDVLLERSWVLPVSETLWVLVWTTSACENQGDHDQSENDENLERGQPEFKLAEELDTEVVDEDDGNQSNSNPDTRVDLVGWDPVSNNHGESSQVVGRNNNVLNKISTFRMRNKCGDTHLEPVIPAEGETESRVDEAMSVSSETGGKRKPCGHLSQSSHDQVCEKTDSGICDKKRTWASSGEGRTTAMLSARRSRAVFIT